MSVDRDEIERRPEAATAVGRAAPWLLVVVVAVALGACGGGNPQDAEAVASCLEGAELNDVDERDVSDAEDIDVLGDAPKNADGFVSAADSEDRDVYVLVYESEKDAKSAAGEITAGGQEAGVRGDNLVVFSRRIGPENRIAVEECFLDAEEGDGGGDEGGN